MRLALIWRNTKLPSSSSSSSSHPYSCCSNPLWSKTKGIQAPENTERLAEEGGLQISLLRSRRCKRGIWRVLFHKETSTMIRKVTTLLKQRVTVRNENESVYLENDRRWCKTFLWQNNNHFTGTIMNAFLAGFQVFCWKNEWMNEWISYGAVETEVTYSSSYRAQQC